MESSGESKGRHVASGRGPVRQLAYAGVVRWVPGVTWWMMIVVSVLFAPYVFVYAFNMVAWIEVMLVEVFRSDSGTSCKPQTAHKPPMQVLVWQSHAGSALVFMATAPFQFHPSFRSHYPALHRALGYLFVASVVIIGLTGGIPMAVVTELGPVAGLASHVALVYFTFAIAMALYHIRAGHHQSHREWMIRVCAFGFATPFMRPTSPILAKAYGMCIIDAVGLSLWFCWVVAVALTELFIQTRYYGFLGIVPLVAPHKEL